MERNEGRGATSFPGIELSVKLIGIISTKVRFSGFEQNTAQIKSDLAKKVILHRKCFSDGDKKRL